MTPEQMRELAQITRDKTARPMQSQLYNDYLESYAIYTLADGLNTLADRIEQRT